MPSQWELPALTLNDLLNEEEPEEDDNVDIKSRGEYKRLAE